MSEAAKPLKSVYVSEMIAAAWKSSRQKWLIIVLLVLFLVLIGWAASKFLPEQIDWVRGYRLAARYWLTTGSPYKNVTFFYPFWILIPMLPIALLPDSIGNGVLFSLELAVILYSAIRLKARPITLIAFMLSFPVLFLLLFGQMDWLVLIGLTLPPPLGLILVFAKPQVAIGYGVFILVESWRQGGFKRVLINFAPVTMLYLISFLIWGLWFLGIDTSMVGAMCNFSAGAIGIPIGLVFTWLSLKTRKVEWSLLAGPFFSPYVCVHSWSIALAALLDYPVEIVIASVGSWGMYFYGIFVKAPAANVWGQEQSVCRANFFSSNFFRQWFRWL